MFKKVFIGISCLCTCFSCYASDWSLGGASATLTELIDFSDIKYDSGFKIVSVMHIPANQEMLMSLSTIAFDCTNQRYVILARVAAINDGSLRQVDVDNNFHKVVANTVRYGTFKEVCHRTRAGFPSDSDINLIIASAKVTMKKMQEKHRR